MRLNEILESKAKEKVKSTLDLDLDLELEKEVNKGNLTSKEKETVKDFFISPELRKASPNAIRQAMKNMSPEALNVIMDYSSRVNWDSVRDVTDEISDQEAMRNQRKIGYGKDVPPPTKENLPTIIGQQLSVIEDNPIEPKWHSITILPGHVQQAIRSIARKIFTNYTRTKMEDLLFVTPFLNLNTKPEIGLILNLLKQKGKKVDEVNIEFHDFVPGYFIKGDIYNAFGYSFMVVNDPAGLWIYVWPEKDTIHNKDMDLLNKNDSKNLMIESNDAVKWISVTTLLRLNPSEDLKKLVRDIVSPHMKGVPLEMAKVMGSMISSPIEMGKVIGMLKMSGKKKELDTFHVVIGGQRMSIHMSLYDLGDQAYLLAQDPGGYWIYTWPKPSNT